MRGFRVKFGSVRKPNLLDLGIKGISLAVFGEFLARVFVQAVYHKTASISSVIMSVSAMEMRIARY